MEIADIFSCGGCIAKNLPNYEERPQQVAMAKAIQDAIEQGKHLIVEAGTGVGKSLAYLVPFIIWCKGNNKKVIITTYTKTLQEQLTKKDLPFIRDCLDMDFEFALCVGSENYLCKRRLNQVWQYELFESQDETKELGKIGQWAEYTETGLRFELDFETKDNVWMKVCRESDLCLSKKCQYRIRDECFYSTAKAFEAKANILVANHHLFFTNLARAPVEGGSGKILPKYDAIVFDEAHNIEDVATEYLGIEVSNLAIKYLLDKIYSKHANKGVLTRIHNLPKKDFRRISKNINEIRVLSEQFFLKIFDEFGSEPISKRIRTPDLFENILEEPLTGLSEELKSVLLKLKDDEILQEVKAYSDRCVSLRNSITTFLEQSLPEYVYWIDITTRQKSIRIELRAVPVDISTILREKVYNKTRSIIFTSATLTVNRKFDFIKGRIGLENNLELLLDSPFDFRKQVLLYIEDNLPDPSYKLDIFKEKVIERIKEILKITKGRTFVLFTSYELLKKSSEVLKKHFSEMEIVMQGEIPKWQMLENFKEGKIDILLGTNTFWQGVDIPGKALECVIITKIPFSVPDDPVTEARMEYIAAQKKDPFINYTLPFAIIMLKQGFGRLIRTKKDYGVVAILDPRIRTRYYGKWFIESLPECKIVNDIDSIEQFYKNNT